MHTEHFFVHNSTEGQLCEETVEGLKEAEKSGFSTFLQK